jgi:hypothetical protein
MSKSRREAPPAGGRIEIGGVPVCIPIGTADVSTRRLAQRIPSLDGARIGILDNCKEFADLVLAGIAEALEKLHPGSTIRTWQKSYLGIASPYTEAMAKDCDVVINGVGH